LLFAEIPVRNLRFLVYTTKTHKYKKRKDEIMFSFLVNTDGGLTTAGYAVSIIAGILIFAAAAFLAGKKTKRKKMTTKQLVFCAMAMALAFVTSYFKLFALPWGGSVTLCSMLFIVLVANWYGVSTGVLVGIAYGLLQFIQEPYVLSFFQVCCDYLFAFAALGVAGFFCKSKNGLVKGYIAAVLARGFFHSLGGYLYWMSYMPDNFPKSLAAVYPIAYNYSYLLAEAVLTLIIISVPAVANALNKVRQMAID
jgi:thiamine transporter